MLNVFNINLTNFKREIIMRKKVIIKKQIDLTVKIQTLFCPLTATMTKSNIFKIRFFCLF